MKLVAFCEAPADFILAAHLVDRVLVEQGPRWVAESAESIDVLRTWRPDPAGRPYFDIHEIDEYAGALRVRRVRGHFDGKPGAAGAAMARKAFRVVEALNRAEDDPVEAVVMMWDADAQPEQRDRGLAQARTDAEAWATFAIVLGLPDPAREAWVLAGFEPADEAEHARLAALRSELELSPVTDAIRLRDKDEGAPRSIKRVLRALTDGDAEREARCWRHTPLDTLRERGAGSGLAAFLHEIAERLVPRFGRGGA